jgi:homoserine dehydrogenase
VKLEEIESTSILGGLAGTANALILSTDLLGEVAVCQLSGDVTQTAYALLSDLVTVGRRAAFEAHS